MTRELIDYYNHPRILELRFMLLYDSLKLEYGYNELVNIFSGLCKSFRCNYTAIKGLMDNIQEIRKLRLRDWYRYRQELVFVGFLQEKSLYRIAKDMGINPSLLYNGKYNYKVEEFADSEWLKRLNKSVTLCGIPQYQKEVYKLLNGIDVVRGAL